MKTENNCVSKYRFACSREYPIRNVFSKRPVLLILVQWLFFIAYSYKPDKWKISEKGSL